MIGDKRRKQRIFNVKLLKNLSVLVQDESKFLPIDFSLKVTFYLRSCSNIGNDFKKNA